ncbi:MAG: hypothetical protein ABIL25_06945 [candidate division WOR-3 bacterium]
MRRTVFGLSVLAAACSFLLVTGCQREGALRIVSINDGVPLVSDIIDFGEFTLPSEPGEPPEVIQIEQIPEDNVEIQLQYVELGLGLPTWTPYQAHITKIQIDYSDAAGTQYDPAVMRTNIVIPADPEGKTVKKATFTLVPSWWKTKYFEDEAQGSPEEEYGEVATLTAKVTVTGYDDASKKDIRAEAFTTIVMGNWWDEPSRLNQ